MNVIKCWSVLCWECLEIWDKDIKVIVLKIRIFRVFLLREEKMFLFVIVYLRNRIW